MSPQPDAKRCETIWMIWQGMLWAARSHLDDLAGDVVGCEGTWMASRRSAQAASGAGGAGGRRTRPPGEERPGALPGVLWRRGGHELLKLRRELVGLPGMAGLHGHKGDLLTIELTVSITG
jgi:hypothetical protein